MIRKLIQRSLIYQSKNNFHSLTGRPIDGFGQNALVDLNINLLGYIPYSDPLNYVILGCGQYLIGACIYRLCRYYFSNNQIGMLNQFICDTFNKDNNSAIQSYKKIDLPFIAASSLTGYYWLAIFRGLNQTSLLAYDPYFILPCLGMATSFILLKFSDLALLETLQNKQNIIKVINLSFMLGLMTVGLPAIYFKVGLAMCWSHILLRSGVQIRRWYVYKRFEKSLTLSQRELKNIISQK